ncbi:carboxypeptidase B-like [Vanessa cardui]|uniref:carboxypeptidase B-like n=1 Tax=Vanessa cardui TaxID=171605 RepID=UPI001F12A9C5|nr:carboxypeptidase B-like [Vanessa cardui]
MFSIFMYIIIITVSSGLCKNELYKGYRIYNIDLLNNQQENNFHVLKSDLIDFLRKPSYKHNVSGQAMVPPSHFEWFEEKLGENNITKDIIIDDVYEYLHKIDLNEEGIDSNFDYNNYHRYDKIISYLKSIEEAYSNSDEISIKLVEADRTDEDRPLVYLTVTAKSSLKTQKPLVIIEAGINPREWITVPAAINVIDKIIQEDQKTFLENLQWIIIPVLNPDGYEYTHTNLRLWTKSRSTRSSLGPICPGVNINRNFDIDWLFSDTSTSPCSHIYGGVEAFSEPETKMIKNLIEKHGRTIRLYISLQNNGRFISYPWQYERAASGMFRQHHLLGLQMISAMGDDYVLDVGSVALGDRTSGTSTDYVMDNEVLYTFNINIEKEGVSGVIIPDTKIKPIAENVWNAVAIAAQSVMKPNANINS